MTTVWDKVLASRSLQRLKPKDYVHQLLEDVTELRGDRLSGDDRAIYGGIARFHGRPVTFIAFAKDHSAEGNIEANFGMANPEGYRKCMRLVRQAEKFQRPILTFIDTPGAYPGVQAEEHGQGEAIAQLMMRMQSVRVPTVALVTGEGGSGGALCLSVCDRILMMEHAIFSILSPEGFSAILWKDKSRAQEAAELMKITPQDLQVYGICDAIVPESEESTVTLEAAGRALQTALDDLVAQPEDLRHQARISKFRNLGVEA